MTKKLNAAWTGCMCMQHKDMNTQHRYEHAAWTWICNMDKGFQHVHGHAALTQTLSIETDMQRGHRHAAWTWTCRIYMQHGYATYMLHAYEHAEWTRSMDMEHGHAAWRNEHAPWTCNTYIVMGNRHAT